MPTGSYLRLVTGDGWCIDAPAPSPLAEQLRVTCSTLTYWAPWRISFQLPYDNGLIVHSLLAVIFLSHISSLLVSLGVPSDHSQLIVTDSATGGI